jgi:hypothetical protein
MARLLIWASTLVVATALGAAVTPTTTAAVPAATTSSRTIATAAGPRPLHMVRIAPGRGVRLEAVWLGGGPGRTGTVGGYIRANAGRGGDLTTLEPYQRDHAYHRTAVGRLRSGQTALVVIGGPGTSARQFAQALIGLGFVEALGMDIDSSANVNWRGTSLNRPDYQRQVPTGIIAFRRAG